MLTPAGMEQFFDHFASLTAADPEAFAGVGGPLGMRILGPPSRSPILCRIAAPASVPPLPGGLTARASRR
jgi:hypothetical protein